jgi:hypothetical protein
VPWAEPCCSCALLPLCCVPLRRRSWCGVLARHGVVLKCGLQPLTAAPAAPHASLPLALARHLLGFAPAVAAGKASERTKALAGGMAGFARLLAVRRFLPHCPR